MRRLFLAIPLFLFLSIVTAQVIHVDIVETLNVTISAISYPKITNGAFKITTEIFNTGSVGYRARVRLDVFDQHNLLYRGWSSETSLSPGARTSSNIYWYEPNRTGNFKGRLRIYYANEINETEINFEVRDLPTTQDIFEISDFRTYDDYIKFSLKSPQTVKNIIAFVSDYPIGWIFEQTKIEKLEQNDKISVSIPYQPSLWVPSEITLSIVTEDGKYYSSKSFNLAKEEGFLKYINYLVDAIRVFFNI